MIVLTQEQAARLIWKDQFAHSVLRPLRLSDGRYALPESALTKPEHARWHNILRQGSIEADETLTFDAGTNTDSFFVDVDGTNMIVYIGNSRLRTFGYPAPNLFDIPTTGLYRFECRYNNDLRDPNETEYHDRKFGRRRSELLQQNNFFQDGETLWCSWTTILTDERDGLDQQNNAIIFQWHQPSSTIIPAPPMVVILNSGELGVVSRYTNTATTSLPTIHYVGPVPESWVITHYVMAGTLGENGHLDMWINGEKVVDEDAGIGYWLEPGGIVDYYVQAGIYMDNSRTVDSLYHANIEFGTVDLSDRIDNPLAVPAPEGGWPVTPDTPYPSDTLYPASNLYTGEAA